MIFSSLIFKENHVFTEEKDNSSNKVAIVVDQGRSQNLKQGPQDFIKTFCVDDVTVTSQLMTPYRKINIASKKIINY